MVKILRLSDRIKVKIGKVSFLLAPLSNDRKIEISSCSTVKSGEQVFDYARAQHLYIKYSLKDIIGVETYDNKPYDLEFEGDYLTDDCVSDIFNLPQKKDLVSCAWQIMNGIPDKIVDESGKTLKGVALEVEKKKKIPG